MSPKYLSILFSILIILLGSVVLIGWGWKLPILVQLLPGMIAMVPNTAICFILLGLGFILHSHSLTAKVLIKTLLFFLVIMISAISLSQDIFGFRAGIDMWANPSWLLDPNPTPGRMAPNTCFGFILCATAGLILPKINNKKMANLLLILIMLIFLLALLGLLVYSLKLEFIFNGYKYTRMAIHTSVGLVLISFILWNLWSQTPFYHIFYKGSEDRRIIMISGALLLTISLISGLGSIASLTYINLSSFHQTLASSLSIKINILSQNIDSLSQNLTYISKDPLLAKSIQIKDTKTLQTLTESLNDLGFTSVRFEDKDKKYLAGEQNFKEPSGSKMNLNLAYKNILYWDKGLWMQFLLPIKTEQHTIGYFLGNYFLANATKMYYNYQDLGTTGEVVLCQHTNENFAECFPSRLTDHAFKITLVDYGKPKPMAYAIKGITGVGNAVDYRQNNVAAAFAPVDNLGIGMVLKIESTEIYSPLRNNLLFIFPMVLLLVGCGLALLRWQVVPLVRKVVDARKETSLANKQLSQKNTEIHFLRDLSSALQASTSLEQSFKFIAQYGENILPETNATLYLAETSQHCFKPVASWGNNAQGHNFSLEECCAARMKRPHHLGIIHQNICPHLVLFERHPYSSCIPLLAHDEIIGVLCLDWGKFKKVEITSKLDLAVAVVEQLALGISNIQLRYTLTQQSIRDPLTGLYNRRYLEETLERELDRAKRGRLPLSLLILDIDKFKTYNDTYGHKIGDYVLEQFSALLKKFTRLGDIACRYGGEEFIVVLLNTSNDIAFKRAEQIRHEVSQLQLKLQQKKLDCITVSIGIASYPINGLEIISLIQAADKALYQAKNTGRNKVISANQI